MPQQVKKRVAVVIDLDWPYRRQQDVFRGIHQYAAEHTDWDCRLLPIVESESEEPQYSDDEVTPLWDGIIARATAEVVKEADRRSIPIVNVWYNSPVATRVPTISPDFEETGFRATQHLAGRGLQRLGFLGFRRDRADRTRYQGISRATRENGHEVSAQWISYAYNRNAKNWNTFQRDLYAWIESFSTPFGVVAGSDLLARYLVEACHYRKLRVPEDVAVIGIGNDDPICLHPEPTLSSISCGYEQVGYTAGQVLDHAMNSQSAIESRDLKDGIRVIPRHSTDMFAVEDPLVAETLHYLAEHCHEHINVSDVIDNVPASRRSLERRFSKVMNRTIAQELNRMRVRRLERLLIESAEPLEVLSTQCGFGDVSQMRRNFLQIRGMNPSAFRKKHQP